MFLMRVIGILGVISILLFMVGPLPWLLGYVLSFFRLVLVFALPLDFHGRLRVLRSMFLPGALHGIEASFLAGTSMRKLRAAFFGVLWSCRQPFANIGAEGVWLIVLGRFLRFVDCWKVLLRVVLVMVLLIQSAAEIGFR